MRRRQIVFAAKFRTGSAGEKPEDYMRNIFMTASDAKHQTASGVFDQRLTQFYGVSGEALGPYRQRIINAIDRFAVLYCAKPLRVFSVSGRTELGGNHTDHQHGRVLAGGISLDMIAIAAPFDGPEIRVCSEGYPEVRISADETAMIPEEQGTTSALIRGITARFAALGKPVRGFHAYVISDVPKGSGLSSSAAFEVLIGTICNDFFADGAFSQAELAVISQYAENEYFGKPCGLMDQMACALGGVSAIDFADPAAPKWEKIRLDLAKEGYSLCIIDSGADHAGLTDEYAAVPAEMKSVAHMLGKPVLRDTNESAFWEQLPAIRKACGDRAVLRAMHFYQDNDRVTEQTAVLRAGSFDRFLALVNASGRSSEAHLQNISPNGRPQQQAVSVALALCERLLSGRGAYRVHGGGFAGTVQAYVPVDMTAQFCAETERVLGKGACHVLQIRACGAAALWDEQEGAE